MHKTAFKALESDAQVPAYLQEALVSELDFIRDTLQLITHFTDGFFGTALVCLTQSNESDPQP